MKILLDIQIYNQQQYGGISRYYTELFSILSKKKKVKVIIPFYSTENIYFKESSLVTFRQKVYSFYIRILIKLKIRYKENTLKRNMKFFTNKVSKQQYDLFVPTYYDTYFVKNIGNTPFVLTVYDMIHELFPEYFLEDTLNVVEKKKYLIEKASEIIAVSENTKKDILKIYPTISEQKIHVVYHGCSIKQIDDSAVILPDNYILFVGTRDNYKNFNFLIESIVELLNSDSDLYLVCAGGGTFSDKEQEQIFQLGLANKIIQKNFKENDLATFYTRAKCFVFPSMYEGFGMPILEAMSCGCPVVLANHSSFPEVAGDAGVYFDLNNKEDLKNKIKIINSDKGLHEQFKLKGLQQVKKFSWEKAANECLKVYKAACSQN